jgi:hypothetical protein
VAFAVGCAVLAYAALCTRRSILARSWPTAPGVILSAHVEATQDSDGAPTRTEQIEFSYVVRGRQYLGRHVTMDVDFRFTFGESGTADVRIMRYSPGREVQVIYDPRNPSRACLEVGSQFGNVFALLLGLAIMLASWSHL